MNAAAAQPAPIRLILTLAIAVTVLFGAVVVWVLKPADVAQNIIAHKSLSVRLVSTSGSIGKIDDFDLDGERAVVASGGALFEPATGKRMSGNTSIRSAAFFTGRIMAITTAGNVVYLDDAGVHTMGAAPLHATRLRSSDAGESLFFISDVAPYELAALDANGTMNQLTESPAAIGAVGGTLKRHFFSVGSDLYYQAGFQRPELLVHLPPEQTIVGIAAPPNEVYFATARGVYMVQNSVALPLELGLGGPLRITAAGVLVLDSASGRIFKISNA